MTPFEALTLIADERTPCRHCGQPHDPRYGIEAGGRARRVHGRWEIIDRTGTVVATVDRRDDANRLLVALAARRDRAAPYRALTYTDPGDGHRYEKMSAAEFARSYLAQTVDSR